jgi:hypothetical protein
MGKGSKSRPLSVSKEDFDNKFEGIFGKYVPPYLRNKTEEIMQVRVKENTNEFGKCGCGRSPTGKCIGWHGLNEDQYKEALEKYLTNQEDLDGNTV